ncbi:MAG: elongation factor G, partial [Phenylobacterium sp.]|uniref:elongation factor G n=1 Tax=Phenylobacterium sp. TaxID=1871053 RepID=UPI002736A856
DELLVALAPASAAPLVARQIPIWEDERVTGFVDLALERAFVHRPGAQAQRIDISPELATLEADARFHMLEQLADFDDELMEQLISDVTPAPDMVFADLVREMNEGLIVPVFFGSAQTGFGIGRLLKALRHETPAPERAARRLGIEAPGACVLKTTYAGQAGKLAYVRTFGAKMADGADLLTSRGERTRVGGLFAVHGAALKKITAAEPGDIVAIGKLEQACVGEVMSLAGKPQTRPSPDARPPLFALAVAASNRQDDVRLSGALAKLVEEDPGLSLKHDAELGQVLLTGQGEGHVRLALDRLKRRFGVEIATTRPRTPYREAPVKSVTQRGRHKKQTGGHGQFGDVVIELRPLARGEGFVFVSKIAGGVVPKQWVPAVEQGIRDGLAKGPLGFPVVDLEVALVDGSHHSVDSSEMAFRAAGRLAIEEALRSAGTILLEPIERLSVYAPSVFLSNVTSSLSSRRGQILGFSPREGWSNWDTIEAYLPQGERHDLIAELRSITQGLGAFEGRYDHMSELAGRLAEEAAHQCGASA